MNTVLRVRIHSQGIVCMERCKIDGKPDTSSKSTVESKETQTKGESPWGGNSYAVHSVSTHLNFLFFSIIYGRGTGYTCVEVRVLSFHRVSSRDGARVTRLGGSAFAC